MKHRKKFILGFVKIMQGSQTSNFLSKYCWKAIWKTLEWICSHK